MAEVIAPYYASDDGRIVLYCGDVRNVLPQLPEGIAQCCVTSPPYWGLRDYGVEGQIGSEQTPQEFVKVMVEVGEGIRRVLRQDGTLWLNLGDSYASDTKGSGGPSAKQLSNAGSFYSGSQRLMHGLKQKDLCMIPARVAIALQEAGWWLRSDIIWSKPNPMPESVTDRPTSAHEHIFLMTQAAKYFYDAAAVKEDGIYNGMPDRCEYAAKWDGKDPFQQQAFKVMNGGRNKRNVWTVATHPFPGSHFATFPPKLIDPCVLAGTSERGQCPQCGSPWERVVDREVTTTGTGRKNIGGGYDHGWEDTPRGTVQTKTVGWQPTCKCGFEATDPQTILDPFNGAGTTGLVALKLGRRYVGVDLNPEYLDMTIKRLEPLLMQPALSL